jgi:hypothetical protein
MHKVLIFHLKLYLTFIHFLVFAHLTKGLLNLLEALFKCFSCLFLKCHWKILPFSVKSFKIFYAFFGIFLEILELIVKALGPSFNNCAVIWDIRLLQSRFHFNAGLFKILIYCLKHFIYLNFTLCYNTGLTFSQWYQRWIYVKCFFDCYFLVCYSLQAIFKPLNYMHGWLVMQLNCVIFVLLFALMPVLALRT